MCQSLPQNCLPSTFFLSKIFPAVVTAAACRQGVIDGVGEGGEILPPPPKKIVPPKMCVNKYPRSERSGCRPRGGARDGVFSPKKKTGPEAPYNNNHHHCAIDLVVYSLIANFHISRLYGRPHTYMWATVVVGLQSPTCI